MDQGQIHHAFRCLLLRALPSGLVRAAPRDVPWVHSETFSLLPGADFQRSVLLLCLLFHVIEFVFSLQDSIPQKEESTSS